MTISEVLIYVNRMEEKMLQSQVHGETQSESSDLFPETQGDTKKVSYTCDVCRKTFVGSLSLRIVFQLIINILTLVKDHITVVKHSLSMVI
uniref:C2H2-type domain-containing protein n=1 Tax=Octopus bimaculoides TaxID=37653 RepID=A0A0L8FT41_OCTBM